MTLHFLNDVANKAKSTQNRSLRHIRYQLDKLINTISGLSSLPGSASRTHVESLGKPSDVIKHSRSLAW